jgi:hypothetical protein
MRTVLDRCVIVALGYWRRRAGTSVEPMAAVTAPARVSAQHQKLLHFVADATRSDERTLAKVHELVMPSITRHGQVEAWIIERRLGASAWRATGKTGVTPASRSRIRSRSTFAGEESTASRTLRDFERHGWWLSASP